MVRPRLPGGNPRSRSPGGAENPLWIVMFGVHSWEFAAFESRLHALADYAVTLAAPGEWGLRHLVEHWWMWCAVERLPALSARLKDCHRRAKIAPDKAAEIEAGTRPPGPTLAEVLAGRGISLP